MALPTNIPVGINVTTTPGQYWTDEDGVSHYTGDVYNYTDQSGNPVEYTPPQLSSGDDNGAGAGEIQVPARWTQQGAVNGYDVDLGAATYANTPYLDPEQQAQKDMYGGAMNPQDASFFPQLQNIIQQTVGGQYSQDQILAAMRASNWWGQLGSGSNPYNAAVEVAQKLGADTSWYNQGTSDQYRQAAEAKSPEGQARAQPHGGLFGEGGGSLGLGDLTPVANVLASTFGGPLGAGAFNFVNSGGDIEAAAKAAALSYAAGAISGSDALASGVSDVTKSLIDSGMSAEAASAFASTAGKAAGTAITSGLSAAVSGKGDPFEAALKGGAFAMLGGSIAKALTLEGAPSALSSTVSKAIVQAVRTGSIDPETLLASAASGAFNSTLSSILKDNGVSAEAIPTFTKFINAAVSNGESDPSKLFSVEDISRINNNEVDATDVAIKDATNTIVDANLTNAGYANTGNGSYTYTYDDGSTITVDANMNPIGSTEASDATNSVGALTDAGYVANNNGTYTYTYDDGSTITVDADMNPIGSTEASDEYTSAGGAGSASGKSGIAGKLGTAVLGGVKNAVKPITTSPTGKPIIAPPTGKASATTPGSTTPGATTPGTTNPAGTANQTQQNQQNSLLMGLLLGEQPQQPLPQQPQQLAKITPYDWNKDILGADDYVNATQSDYFTGGSVSAVNEELLRMLRS
jgi:organic hydroperoxide reductase OsmC/OhrA